jgi:hypothetical protein
MNGYGTEIPFPGERRESQIENYLSSNFMRVLARRGQIGGLGKERSERRHFASAGAGKSGGSAQEWPGGFDLEIITTLRPNARNGEDFVHLGI